MGCGCSVAKAGVPGKRPRDIQAELKDAETQLLRSQKQHEEQDHELAAAKAEQRGLVEEIQSTAGSPAGGLGEEAAVEAEGAREEAEQSVEVLRAELASVKSENEEALRKEKERLNDELEGMVESTLEARKAELRQSIDSQTAELKEESEAESQTLKRQHEVELHACEANAQARATKLRTEADSAEEEIRRLAAEIWPLRSARQEAALELREARSQLEAAEAQRRLRESEGSATERRLAEAQQEQTKSELRFASLESNLQAQATDVRAELRVKTEELRQREHALREREQELSEVSTQLTEMQELFDEVNGQLQAECKRIEKLQDSVCVCAKQGKELEALQNMLEESHRMLAQVREALEHERSKRVETARLLEEEQQRTHLLLEVLKHFKEKLQGLTPQMLLSRLAGMDVKAAPSGSPGSHPGDSPPQPAAFREQVLQGGQAPMPGVPPSHDVLAPPMVVNPAPSEFVASNPSSSGNGSFRKLPKMPAGCPPLRSVPPPPSAAALPPEPGNGRATSPRQRASVSEGLAPATLPESFLPWGGPGGASASGVPGSALSAQSGSPVMSLSDIPVHFRSVTAHGLYGIATGSPASSSETMAMPMPRSLGSGGVHSGSPALSGGRLEAAPCVQPPASYPPGRRQQLDPDPDAGSSNSTVKALPATMAHRSDVSVPAYAYRATATE